MGVVEIYFRKCDGEFPLDEVVTTLLATFDGAKVTNDDWYGHAKRTLLKLAEERKKAGQPMLYSDAILNDLEAAEGRAGRRKELSIPTRDSIFLQGSITKHLLVIVADCPLKNNETVKSIIRLLQSMGVVAEVKDS